MTASLSIKTTRRKSPGVKQKTTEQIHDFLDAFVNWASARKDVQSIALVGSYARGTARDDSHIDLVLLTEEPQKVLEDLKWIDRFGVIEKHQTEDYGRLISIRVWYQNGVEVEYGITMGNPPSSNLTTSKKTDYQRILS